MNSKGFIGVIIYLILGLMVIAGSIILWNVKKQLDATQPVQSTIQVVKVDPTKDWKELKIDSIGINLKYPPDWLLISDTTISQALPSQALFYPNVHNTISISQKNDTLYPGYYNRDLFNIIYFLQKDKPFTRDFFNSDQEKIFKLDSGTTLTHERFVIFKTEGKNPLDTKKVSVFVLKKDDILLIFILNDFDDFGYDIFKKILSNSSLFAEKPT